MRWPQHPFAPLRPRLTNRQDVLNHRRMRWQPPQSPPTTPPGAVLCRRLTQHQYDIEVDRWPTTVDLPAAAPSRRWPPDHKTIRCCRRERWPPDHETVRRLTLPMRIIDSPPHRHDETALERSLPIQPVLPRRPSCCTIRCLLRHTTRTRSCEEITLQSTFPSVSREQ